VVHDITLDLRPQGARRDGEGDMDRDVPALDVDPADHAEVHDGVAQLGVDHGPQAVAHLGLLASVRPRGRARLCRQCLGIGGHITCGIGGRIRGGIRGGIGRWAHGPEFYLREVQFQAARVLVLRVGSPR